MYLGNKQIRGTIVPSQYEKQFKLAVSVVNHARALKKGQFKEDLQKTKDLIDLWLREESN